MEVVALALRFVLGWLVLAVGLAKLMNIAQFEEAVRRYALLPEGTVRLSAWILVGLEVGFGVLLLAGVGTPIFALLLALLFAAYAAAMAVNLLRGRRTECGCGTTTRMISWVLVGRNAALVAAAVIVAAWPVHVLSAAPITAGGHPGIDRADAVAIALVATILLPLYSAIAEGVRLWRLRARLSAAAAR